MCNQALPWGSQSWLQPPFRRLRRATSKSSSAVRRRLKAGGSQDWLPHALALFGINVYVCWGLFSIEYLQHMGSIEASFIGISRYMLDHWRELLSPAWFPLWYTGIPAQNTYPPLLHATVALAAGTARVSPAHAYHFVTAVFYCLGPVALFALVLRLNGSRWAAFFAGAFYSVLSPAGWLIPAMASDIGEILRPIRLRDMVVWGEGPHITSLTLLPIALLLLDLALDRKRPRYFALAALGLSSVPLTNVIGGVALAFGVAAYLLAKAQWRDTALTAAIGVAAYCLAVPWIPPSTIATIRDNAKLMGADYTNAYKAFPVWMTAAILALGILKMLVRRQSIAIQFAIFFTFVMAAPPLLSSWAGIAIVPQPERYHVEMEMGLAILASLAIQAALTGASPRARWIVTIAMVLALVVPLRSYRRFARGFLIQSIDIATTSEWKTAQWLNRNWSGGRVLLPGSSCFWLAAFSDTPQLSGGVDQGAVLPVIPMARYQITTGDGAGSRAAEIAILWFKALGVEAVGVTQPGSTEIYKDFRNPNEFEGVLEPLWRDGGDVLYRVTAHRSLAHVMHRGDLAARTPANGIDVEPLQAYVAALDNAQSPAATFEYKGLHSAAIQTELSASDVVSVQVAWHPGWHAEVNGQPETIFKDALGFMYLQPSGVTGPVQIALTYDGGTEMQVARWLSGVTALVLLGAYFFASFKSMVATLRVSNTLSLFVGLLIP